MFDTHATVSNLRVLGLLCLRQFTTTWFLVWLCYRDPLKRKAYKTQILQEFAPIRQWIGCLVSNGLVVNTPLVGIAQKWNPTRVLTEQDILYGWTLFLAAPMRFLLKVVLGADNWPFRSIVIKRGAAPS